MSLNNRIALDTSRSVVVQACAGSGKTWLLSSRIARALLEGVLPREILALTFTNKAAAEMRNRVITHLRELAVGSDAEREKKLKDDWGLSGDALQNALHRAPSALARFLTDPQPPVISTFHSWYIRLAAMAPLTMAGVATMSLAQRPWDLMRQAWQMFYAEQAQASPYALLVQVAGAQNTREAMEAWVRQRVEWRAFGHDGDRQLGRLNAATAAQALAQALADNAHAVEDFYRRHVTTAQSLARAFKDSEKRESFHALMSQWNPDALNDLRDTVFTTRKTQERIDELQALEKNDALPSRFKPKGGAYVVIRSAERKRWGAAASDYEQQFDSLCSDLETLLHANDARLMAARTQALWVCGRLLADCMDVVMAKSHEIDFSGLEQIAWDLLAGELAPAFHARLDTRIRHVLVDEFQDTNPTQWGMLKAWLSQYEQADAQMRARAPKVFLVGDDKQSIYRFRRADSKVFEIAANWLNQHYGAQALPTDQTRRCGKPIVDFLNSAMPEIEVSPVKRFRTHTSIAQANDGEVKRLPIAKDWKAEGEQIARALNEIRKKYSGIKWSAVRILVRTRTHMAHYENALAAAGIPFVSDRAGGLLKEPEVRDVIALLRFLAFPWSDVDCAHALKSPLFGLGDDLLAQVALHPAPKGTTFFERLQMQAADARSDSLLEAAAALFRWREWSADLPVHDLLDRILHEQDVFERMAGRFAHGRGPQCIANLEAFIALALDLDTGRLPSLPRFLQELHRWSQVKDADAPGPGVMPNIDAVSISTIHGAKGLEADVVVLAGLLDREMSDKGLRWLIDWNRDRDGIDGLTTWQGSDPMTDTAARALRDDRRQSDDEDFNLLYVGITRARRVLLFSAAEGGKEIDKKWFGKIQGHCEEWRFADQAQGIAPDAAAVVRSAPPSSALSLTWRGQVFDKRDRQQVVRPPVETLAMRQGKALHRLLEYGPSVRTQTVAALMAPFALPQAAREQVLQAVAKIAATEFAKTVFDSARLVYAESEWPIVSDAGIALIRPDRIVRISESPEIWWIIDFKWQLLDSERRDYAAQLTGYQQQFRAIRPQACVEARILTSDAAVWELRDGRLVAG